MKSLTEVRVDRGIWRLDNFGPEDWRERINLDTLDLRSLSNCILGQLYGEDPEDWQGWRRGMISLFPHLDRPEWNDIATVNGFDASDGDYDELTEEWKRALSS